MSKSYRYFNSSPEIIGLTIFMYIRYPLSLRHVEDLLFERGIDICHDPKGSAEQQNSSSLVEPFRPSIGCKDQKETHILS